MVVDHDQLMIEWLILCDSNAQELSTLGIAIDNEAVHLVMINRLIVEWLMVDIDLQRPSPSKPIQMASRAYVPECHDEVRTEGFHPGSCGVQHRDCRRKQAAL